jgi:hypothetical protein
METRVVEALVVLVVAASLPQVAPTVVAVVETTPAQLLATAPREPSVSFGVGVEPSHLQTPATYN